MSVSPELDDLDSRILGFLRDDGRLSNRELGRRLGLSEASTRARVQRLQKSGLLRHWLQIHNRVFKELASAYVGVRTEPAQVRQVAKAIGELPGCYFVGLSLGRFNLFTYFLTATRDELYTLMRESLEPLPGVTAISVREVLHIVKHPLQIGSALDDRA